MDDFAAARYVSGERATFDTRVIVQYRAISLPDVVASRREGRPIYESADFAVFQQVGSKDETFLPVQQFFRNFPDPGQEEHERRRYAQWVEGRREDIELPGTPLAVLFVSEPHVIDSCRAMKITRVEQLAAINEDGMRRLGMGGRKHVERARAFLEAASKGMSAREVEAKLAERDAEMLDLKQKIEQLQAANVAAADDAALEAATRPDREPHAPKPLRARGEA